MTTLFQKTVYAKIDYDDIWAGCVTHQDGEARWEFTLFEGVGAFEYGNQTGVSVNISSLVNGKSRTDHKIYDTRYAKGITNEKKFEEFCLGVVEEWYGTNAKEVQLV